MTEVTVQPYELDYIICTSNTQLLCVSSSLCASTMESKCVCGLCHLRLKTKQGDWQMWVNLDKEIGKILDDPTGSWHSERVGKILPTWEKCSSETLYVDKVEDDIYGAYVCHPSRMQFEKSSNVSAAFRKHIRGVFRCILEASLKEKLLKSFWYF